MTRIQQTGTVLDRIVAQTASDLEARKASIPEARLMEMAALWPPPVDVEQVLRAETVTVIAEIKRASPSRGRFPVEFDPADVAAAYTRGGASAISCLTDTPFFQGSLADLESVARVASDASPPVGVLRKDFMLDSYQVLEARASGASCILLIAACLAGEQLRLLREHASELGLATLVEVHDERELDRALTSGATMVGVNNRDLHTFSVSLDVTARLAPSVPPEVVLVGESGIFTRQHVEQMASAGVDAVLVGESLIVQADRAAAVAALTGVPRSARG